METCVINIEAHVGPTVRCENKAEGLNVRVFLRGAGFLA